MRDEKGDRRDDRTRWQGVVPMGNRKRSAPLVVLVPMLDGPLLLRGNDRGRNFRHSGNFFFIIRKAAHGQRQHRNAGQDEQHCKKNGHGAPNEHRRSIIVSLPAI